jgi:hypothetical protein
MVATEAIQAMNSEDKGQVHEEDAGVSRSLAYVYTL